MIYNHFFKHINQKSLLFSFCLHLGQRQEMYAQEEGEREKIERKKNNDCQRREKRKKNNKF